MPKTEINLNINDSVNTGTININVAPDRTEPKITKPTIWEESEKETWKIKESDWIPSLPKPYKSSIFYPRHWIWRMVWGPGVFISTASISFFIMAFFLNREFFHIFFPEWMFGWKFLLIMGVVILLCGIVAMSPSDLRMEYQE